VAISRWERGIQRAPADGYIKLGNLAGWSIGCRQAEQRDGPEKGREAQVVLFLTLLATRTGLLVS
jgi:hypothetical protein